MGGFARWRFRRQAFRRVQMGGLGAWVGLLMGMGGFMEWVGLLMGGFMEWVGV